MARTAPRHQQNDQGVQGMNDLLTKAWRVINSCETPKQARGAMRYLELLAERYPDLDVSALRRELRILFEI